MKNNRMHLLLVLLFLYSSNATAQVDPHFSQYYANQLWLNPAQTGTSGDDYRVTANYRRQWTNIGSGFKTAAVSADFATEKNINMGVSLLNQAAGTGGYNYTNGQLTLSYTGIRFGDEGQHRFSFGMNLGLLSRRFDAGKLQAGDQWQAGVGFNPAVTSSDVYNRTAATSADIGAGIAYYNASEDSKFRLYGGISATHLNQPKDPFLEGNKSVLSVRSCFYGGVMIQVTDAVKLVPNMLYMRQGTAREQMIGVYGQFSVEEGVDLMAGLNGRLKDAIVPYAGLSINNFTLGFSYDATVSQLSQLATGTNAFEFSLTFRKKNNGNGSIACPRL